VTGTQANRSIKNQPATKPAPAGRFTAPHYMGATSSAPSAQGEAKPAPTRQKVGVTATSHGNRFTGNEVGRSEKSPAMSGTCKTITGRKPLGQPRCGLTAQTNSGRASAQPSPARWALGQTLAGRPILRRMVGRSEKVTGD